MFVNENFKINGLSKIQLQKDSNFINQVIRSSVTKKKNFLTINLNSSQKIIFIKIKNSQLTLENEKKGADFFEYIKYKFFNRYYFLRK